MRAALISAVFAALAVSTNGAAVEKRQAAAPALTDADILNFALVLEHLEATFYSQALSNFSASDFTSAGYASNIRANIETIAADEAEHVSFLTSALSAAGATPVQACRYNFPYTSVDSFLALSQVLEGVGTSAYLGAAQYIQNPAYLTAAGAILTSEARHTAFIRYVNGFSPAVTFDTPLTPTSVQSIATPFFVSCPDGSAPPFTPFPAANLTSANATIGSTIQVSYANSTSEGNKYCIFLSGLGQAISPYQNGSCEIPSQNVTTGQAYGVISSSASGFNDSTVLAGPFVLNFDRDNNTASSGAGATRGGSNSTVGSNAAATTGAASKTSGVTAAAGLAMGLVAAAAATLF